MPADDPLKDLELLIRSRYAVILLESAEEDRAESLLKHLADRLSVPLFTWTPTKGLRQMDLQDDAPIAGTADLAKALALIEQSPPAIYQLREVDDAFKDALPAARLKDAAARFTQQIGGIVLTGLDVVLPESLRPLSAAVKLPAPRPEEYRDLLMHIVRDLSAKTPVRVQLPAPDVNRLLNNLKGLTLMEAGKILTKAILEDGRLLPEDIGKVIEAKKAIVEREGLLEYYPAQERMADIADLAGLKAWLAKRTAIIAQPQKATAFGLSFPKGVLLLGIQGCGKSLCAKAVASEWGLPLLKLDPSNLYNKYIGESERNFKRAIRMAEQMAPVVLWIDEIEKAFASSGSEMDGGVSQRIFGTFLSWLQDRKGDVFVVATANDIEKLPPEFVRKGRFDEIFFVDLPDAESRRAVFEIHLKKRGKDAAAFDLPALVKASEGFSGAEIEQAIVSGLYTAFSAGAALSSAALQAELAHTRPISLTMGEKIEALREWAKERTVSAQ